ncbi:MAG: hypothetical protein P0Y65_07270 [Candidatus Devosia phytovorans]|uniref:SPOR domain-containing protein n=1 Tax=Candidatus Devosia phytovorans TaxID=3121372 RepID=A0AAJ5VZ17_9HYPH|nr:hypothetical protein [Devosia sp.]WEK06047.1 MAG: hypothetical protein P0Y65_07270 [Devosia sp.]
MAKASEQFRQSDVTTWGIVALVMGGVAVMGANVSAIMPQGLLSGLHKTRVEGASVEQLRVQVGELREATQTLRRENTVLTERFNLGEQQSGEVVRRVGALEVSLPQIMESYVMASGPRIDPSSTAAITADPATVFEADGGSVLVRQQPLLPMQAPASSQPLPAPIGDTAVTTLASPSGYGIAVGPAVAAEQAPNAWRDYSMKLGPLLFGLAPRLAEESSGDDMRIIAGPITQLAEATALCERLERISVACMPVPYTGTPLDY